MSKGYSPDVMKMLSAADKRAGLPDGTMLGVMKQEIGGRTEFLEKPDTYHYAPDANGRRVAKHTGKVSTAFGPFGILESTAKDPGYGVQPLKDKSLEEQVRFASDYLAARSKKGGLKAGLAGYGEGDKYAAQVLKKVPGAEVQQAQAAPVHAAPVQVAAVGPVADPLPATPTPEAPPLQAVPVPESQYQMAATDPWVAFQQSLTRPVQAQDLQRYEPLAPLAQVEIPDFASVVKPRTNPLGFGVLSALKGFA